MKFKELGLKENLLEGLDAMGFEKATPIQQEAIPQILNGRDLVACAQTGTGKTAAFILPMLHLINSDDEKGVKALIISPTRELAMQIDRQIEGLAYFTSASSIAVYGGGSGDDWTQQKNALDNGVEIITATPGRLISMITTGSVDLSKVKYLVLDEADRMMDMGFYNEVLRIIKALPKGKQTLMFSATMPDKMRTLVNSVLNDPFQINLSISKPAAGVDQRAYLVFDDQKIKLLTKVLDNPDFNSVIIFAARKTTVNDIYATLKKIESSCAPFHSGLEQSEREEIMRKFKNKRLRILVGTDVISRGIDVENISLVVNFDVPGDAEDYVHRVGRTARAEKTGVAITFINQKDQENFRKIEKLIETDVKKVSLPEELGKGPEYNPNKKFKGGGGFKKKKFGNKNKSFKKKPFKNNSNNKPQQKRD